MARDKRIQKPQTENEVDQAANTPALILSLMEDGDVNIQSSITNILDALGVLKLAEHKLSAMHFQSVMARREQEARRQPSILVPSHAVPSNGSRV